MINKLKLFSTILLFTGILSVKANDSTSVNYMPEFHATLKPRVEFDADNGAARFQVRNARLGALGNITKELSYKLEVDFCDRGKIKVLDAYAGLQVIKGLQFQLGQIVIPFGIDAPRANFDYIFGDLSYVGLFNGAIRGCGAKINYTIPKTGLNLSGSVYNNYEMTVQNVWQKSMSAAVEGRYSIGPITPVVGFETCVPDEVRINSLDCALLFTRGRWQVEGEYMMKHYASNSFKTAHAYNVLARYTMPVRVGVFNRLTFQGRFDGMTDYSDGTRDSKGRLITSGTESKRASIGTTLGYSKGQFLTYLRLDYYHTFIPGNVSSPIPAEGANKLLAEIVVHF